MILCTIKYILSDQQFLINKSPSTCYIVQSFHKNVKYEFSDWARSELWSYLITTSFTDKNALK